MPEQRQPEEPSTERSPKAQCLRTATIDGTDSSGSSNAPTHYGDQGRVNETHAQQQQYKSSKGRLSNSSKDNVLKSSKEGLNRKTTKW